MDERPLGQGPVKIVMPLVVAMAAIAILAYYDTSVPDSDLWWHMAYGRTVIETGSPRIEHSGYAWTDDSARFIYVTWLGDVILYLTYRLGGTGALTALQILLYAGIVLLFSRMSRQISRTAALAVVVVLLLSFISMRSTAVILKNTMFSIAFYACLFAVLVSFRRGRHRFLWFLPPLFLVWVNTHGEASLGLAVLAAYCAAEIALRILRHPASLSAFDTRRLIVTGALCATALLANPEGWNLPYSWFEKAFVAQDVAGQGIIMDTMPLYPRLASNDIFGAPWAAAVWIWLFLNLISLARFAILVKNSDWEQIPLAFISLGCAAATWLMVRLLPLGVMAWLFTTGLWLVRLPVTDRPRMRLGLTAFVALFMMGAVGARLVLSSDVIGHKNRLTAAMPVAAARFLAEYELTGPMFNDYLSGGYLIWALGKDYPVFIDPRYGPYDHKFLYAYFAFESAPSIEELEATTENAALRTALVRHRGWHGQMCLFFKDAPSWELVFVGPNAAVYVHKEAMTPALAQAAERALSADNFANERDVSVLGGILRAMLGSSPGEVLRLYRIAERNVPDYKLLKKSLRLNFVQYCIQLAFTHGQDDHQLLPPEQVRQRFAMYYLNGQLDLARLVATGYLALYPDDAEMHYSLACAETMAGDLDFAARALDSALALGYERVEQIHDDPDLEPLRSTPEFARIMQRHDRRTVGMASFESSPGGLP